MEIHLTGSICFIKMLAIALCPACLSFLLYLTTYTDLSPPPRQYDTVWIQKGEEKICNKNMNFIYVKKFSDLFFAHHS
jgi:hypothetical protein